VNKAIIFDMDGVIFDSENAVFQSWLALSKKYGFENLEIPYKRCIGVNAAAARQIFLDYYGEDFPYDTFVKEHSKNFHAKYDHGNLPMKPGVVELLEYLSGEGYHIGIASSTRIGIVEQEITDAGLRKYFHKITGGDMVKNSKPAPDIFLMAAEGIPVPPEEILVIEDSYNGIRAAKAAGMFAIMVPDMLEPNEEMKQLADVILNSLAEVKIYLEKSKM